MYVVLDDCKFILRQPHFERTRFRLVFLQTTGSGDVRCVGVFGSFGLVEDLVASSGAGSREQTSTSRQLLEKVASIGGRSIVQDARVIIQQHKRYK